MGRLTKAFVILFTLSIGGYLLYLSSTNYRPKEACGDLPREEKSACLREEFDGVLRNYGVGEGFDLLTFLYEKDSDFPPVCHDYTHLIGEEAYKRYSRGERFKLTSSTSYCGYGFYHGFIVSLFKDGKGKSDASEFCSWANSELSQETNTTSLDCYHGVGHGMVDFSITDSSSGINLQDVLNSALNLCKEVAKEDRQYNRCVNGVYHSSLDLNRKEPDAILDFCFSQKSENRKECFSASSSFIMMASGEDFGKSTLLVAESLEKDIASLVIRSMAGYEAYRSVNNREAIKDDVKICKSLALKLKEECIRGLIEGITDFGIPNEEETGVKLLCEDTQFTQEEEKFCFAHAVDYFQIYFGEEKKGKLCRIIGEENCLSR